MFARMSAGDVCSRSATASSRLDQRVVLRFCQHSASPRFSLDKIELLDDSKNTLKYKRRRRKSLRRCFFLRFVKTNVRGNRIVLSRYKTILLENDSDSSTFSSPLLHRYTVCNFTFLSRHFVCYSFFWKQSGLLLVRSGILISVLKPAGSSCAKKSPVAFLETVSTVSRRGAQRWRNVLA